MDFENKILSKEISQFIWEKEKTLGTAESCTGGNIAHEITEIAGSSDYYVGSVVSYSNEVKQSVLGVSPSVLAAEGAVSKPVVEQMCRGVGALLRTQCSIATSGIAGPGGGSLEKPVGTVWICVQCGEKQVAERCHFPGTRDRVIDRATMTGMLMLIKLLRS